jgi:phosphoheptose isomerase
VAALLANTIPTTARADVITDWNQNMLNAALVPPATNPLVMTRVAAIVQSAVFDAVNGIERRYTPIHVEPAAPRGASRRAAAVQAAYATLVILYPAQQSTLVARRTDSLAGIATTENSQSIARGIQWGQTVADGILAWRGTDGFTPPPPPFMGSLDVGKWRPTPPAFLPGAGPQFATMTPWAINSPSQFRPAGPPALTSARYTTDFNETKTMGSLSSVSRTSDQTQYSLFWNAGTVSSYWDRIALSLAEEHHFNFSKKARLLALLNISIADAAIGCWDAKYDYIFWRPVTAIPLADTDGNPNTIADPGWQPLFATPNHPEYPSGHSCASGAAGRVLERYFGDHTPFSVQSDVMLGVVRSFPNFAAALEEIKNARVFAGIHFRTACNDGQALGVSVSDYVIKHKLRRVDDDDDNDGHGHDHDR